MFAVIAFGLAAGAGIQAWRQWPGDGPSTPSSAIVVTIVAVVFAYLGGRWHGRGGATATATAVAVSSAQSAAIGNTVQVFVAAPGGGVQAVDQVARVPSSAAPWIDSERGPVLEGSMLEGMDLDELVDQVEDFDHSQ